MFSLHKNLLTTNAQAQAQAQRQAQGFTLIELVAVLVLLGILATVSIPKFVDLQTDAKKQSLKNIAAQIESTIRLVQAKARAQGLSIVQQNPGPGISQYILHFDFGAVEVGYENLCPETIGELGDKLTFRDFMNLNLSGGMTDQLSQRYYKIGYVLPGNVDQVSTTEGCYVFYNSWGYPDCDVQVVDVDC